MRLTRSTGNLHGKLGEEVRGIENGIVATQDIFEYEQEGADFEELASGRFVATGVRPTSLERMEAEGYGLPESMFERRVLRSNSDGQ